MPSGETRRPVRAAASDAEIVSASTPTHSARRASSAAEAPSSGVSVHPGRSATTSTAASAAAVSASTSWAASAGADVGATVSGVVSGVVSGTVVSGTVVSIAGTLPIGPPTPVPESSEPHAATRTVTASAAETTRTVERMGGLLFRRCVGVGSVMWGHRPRRRNRTPGRRSRGARRHPTGRPAGTPRLLASRNAVPDETRLGHQPAEWIRSR